MLLFSGATLLSANAESVLGTTMALTLCDSHPSHDVISSHVGRHGALRCQMDPSGKSKGPPPAVKKVLSLFGSGREEDRMVGYLSFLKVGPKLLRFLPGSPSYISRSKPAAWDW